MQNRPIPDTLAKAFSQPSSVFSIDVECVATGLDHNARDVAQISLVVISHNTAFLCAYHHGKVEDGSEACVA